MFARSFLFKLLNFSKSSRLVFVATVIFVNQSNIDANPNTVNRSTAESSKKFNERIRSQRNQTPSVQANAFERTPTWPA